MVQDYLKLLPLARWQKMGATAPEARDHARTTSPYVLLSILQNWQHGHSQDQSSRPMLGGGSGLQDQSQQVPLSQPAYFSKKCLAPWV